MNTLKKTIFASLFTLLFGCGGASEEVKDNTVEENISDKKNVPEEKIADVQTFNYQRKVSGKSFSSKSLVTVDYLNSTADIVTPSNNDIVRGNITVEVKNIEDEDGIEKIWLGFNGSDKAQLICSGGCDSPYQLFETGINPFNYSQTPGVLQLQIWIEDKIGNVSLAETQQVNWLPNNIIINEINREADRVTLSWANSKNSIRYNAYISDSPIDNIENFILSGVNQRFLSLATTNHVFEQLEPRKNYYGLITGIDGSGESAFSEDILINASEIITPIAVNDEYEIEQFSELTGNLIENDSANGFGPITLSLEPVIAPEHGQLTLFENGDFSYKPNNNFFGFDSFKYRIVNPQGIVAEASVIINIKQINTPPLALFNHFIVPANEQYNVSNNELILNDIDFDGDELSINTEPVEDVSNGTLTISATGSFSYLPNEGFEGEDSFVYQLEDGRGGIATAEVKLIVTNEVLEPAHISVNDEYILNEDAVLSIELPGILINDKGEALEQLSLSISQPTINGTLELTGSGAFRYFPNENFYGIDYFIYELEDSTGLKTTAFVTLNINSVNDAPLALTDQITVSQNQAIEISVLENDLDVDSEIDKASLKIIESASNGSVSINSTLGTVTYKSNSNFRGQDSFTYSVSDSEGVESNIATVYVNVSGINTSPLAENDLAETEQNQAVEINILLNDSDPDGSIDISSVKIISSPENGQAIFSIQQDVLIYTPNDGYFGSDSLTYMFNDNEGAESNIAIVNITVARVNIAPIANNDSFTVTQNVASPLDVLLNDSDVDGSIDTSSIEIIETTKAGTLETLSNGALVYTSSSENIFVDSFTYRVKDNEGLNSNIATVSIEINQVDTSPIALSESLATSKNQSISFNVLSNDNFKDISVAQNPVVIEAQPSHGEIFIENMTGQLSYMPNFNFVGTDTFTYRAVNSKGESSDAALVNIMVNNKNYTPIIQPAEVNITTEFNNGDPIINLMASDPDNDEIIYELLGEFVSLFTVNQSGAVSINDIETIIANGNAQYIVNIKVCDVIDPPLCAESTLTVNVEEILPTEIAVINTDYAENGVAKINLRGALEYHEVGKSITLPDGSFLIASGIGHYDEVQGRNIHRAAITKVNSSGDIDNSFANEGVFETDLGILVEGLPQNVVAQNLVYDEINKLIYVSGYIDQVTTQDFFILRLTEVGELDKSFANDGYFILASDTGQKASSVALDLQDNAIIGLVNYDISGLIEGHLMRFNTSTFTVTHNANLIAEVGTEATGFTVLSNSQLMVFGNTLNANNNADIFLNKFNISDLTLDTSFQNAGAMTIDLAGESVDNRIKSLITLSDNMLLMTGDHLISLGDFSSSTDFSLFLLKMDIAGNFDTSFNGTGFRIYADTELPTYSEDVDLLSLSAQGVDLKELDNSIFITINRETHNTNFAVQMMKVDLNGEVDASWLSPYSGITFFDDDGIRSHGALQTPEGFVIFGHNHHNVGYNYFASQWFAKVYSAGTLDNTFGYLGQSTLNSSSSDEIFISSAKQSNGNLLLSGHTLNWQNERVPYIHSLSDLGAVDKSFGKQGLSRLNFYSDTTSGTLTVAEGGAIYLTGNEGEISGFVAKLTNTGLADNFYAHSNEASYIPASDFASETIKILDLKELPNQEQLILSETFDGCINKSVGIYLSAIGDIVNSYTFEPPAGYECSESVFKLDKIYVSELGIYGIGTDSQTYSTPRIVITNVDTEGNFIPSFGDAGLAVIDIGSALGDIVSISGYIVDPEGSFYIYGNINEDNFIVKVNNQGAIDSTFATNGLYKYSIYFDDFVDIKQVMFDSQNKLLVFSQSQTSEDTYITRLLESESTEPLDLAFNELGYQSLNFGVNKELVEVQYHNDNESFLIILQDSVEKRIAVTAIMITEQ
jgi:uncharacterized delta-60 repeat protein